MTAAYNVLPPQIPIPRRLCAPMLLSVHSHPTHPPFRSKRPGGIPLFQLASFTSYVCCTCKINKNNDLQVYLNNEKIPSSEQGYTETSIVKIKQIRDSDIIKKIYFRGRVTTETLIKQGNEPSSLKQHSVTHLSVVAISY